MAARVPLGVGFVLAVCYAVVVLIDLPVGIALWVSLLFVERLQFTSIAPQAGALLIAVAWLGALRPEGSPVRAMLREHRMLVTSFGLLLLWLSLSALWSSDPDRVLADLGYWTWAGGTLAVLVTAISRARDARMVAAAFVAGAVISASIGFLDEAFGFLNDPNQSDTVLEEGRLGGGSGNPNDLAAGLVPAIAVAAGLAGTSRRIGLRLAILGAMALLAVGLAATESRGGLIAACVVVVSGLVLAGKRRVYVVAALLVIVGVASAWFAASPQALERVTTVSEDRGAGREDLWKVAQREFADHPLLGVGLNNFEVEAVNYVSQPGDLRYVEYIVDQPKHVHNAYLELLAETGPLGLLLYLTIIGSCLRAAWLAIGRFDRVGDDRLSGLSRAVVVGMLGSFTASIFASNSIDLRNWALFALGPVMLSVARARAGGEDEAPTW